MTDPTLDEQVEALFPVGGPHGDDATRAAGRSIAALVRYLNHATRHDTATPYPSTVDSVTRSLSAAVFNMGQLLRQLDQRLTKHDLAGRMYDDTGEDPAIRVEEWRTAVGRARTHLAEAASALQYAAGHSNHLELRDDGDGR